MLMDIYSTRFVECDVTKWEDLVRLFREAVELSPSGKIHYVIPNAGITHTDDVFTFNGMKNLEVTQYPVLTPARPGCGADKTQS